MSRLSPRGRGIALATVAMIGISTDSYFTRLADADGFDVAFWVGVFTTVVATGQMVLVGRRSPLRALVDGGRPLLMSGLLQAGSTLAFLLAVKVTSVANVVVIIAAAPLAAAVIGWVWLRERTPGRLWVAIGVAMVGIVLVISGSFGGGRPLGDALAVVAITLFGFNLVLWRRHPDLDRTAMVGLGGLFMAVISVVPAQLFGHSTLTWVALVLMGAVVGPAARILLSLAPRYLLPAEVALFTPIETVLGTLWAFLAFGEEPSNTTYIGGFVVVAAVMWGVRQQTGTDQPPSPSDRLSRPRPTAEPITEE